MQQGGRSQRHSFQVRRPLAVIPLLYNGSARIKLLALRLHCVPLSALVLSTRRSIRLLRFCLAFIVRSVRPRARLSGNRFEAYSSSSAYLWYWAVFYDGQKEMSRGRNGCSDLESITQHHFHFFFDSISAFFTSCCSLEINPSSRCRWSFASLATGSSLET